MKEVTSKESRPIFLRAGLFNSEMRLKMAEEVFSGGTCEDEGFQTLGGGEEAVDLLAEKENLKK